MISSQISPLSIFNIHYSMLSHRYKVKYVQLSTYHIQYSILSHRYQVKYVQLSIFNIPYCHTDIKSIISIFLMTTVAFASPHTITQQAKRKQIRSSQRSLQRCPRCSWNKNFFSHFTWHGSPMCRVFMRIIWRLDYILCLSVILAMKWVRIRKFDILHCQSYVGFSFF